ncbi:MAG: EAL domain-containing protein [Actinomycetota bacterium]|nr:EAL domain-containing protein [Actinomycetota bacterium]
MAEAAERAATLEDAGGVALDAVCGATGWAAARLAVPPASVWHLADPDRFELLRRGLEAARPSLGGDRQPVWSTDVHALATSAGVSGVLRVPIVVGSDVAGVLEFFGEDASPPDPAVVDLAAAAATILARVAERVRTAAALRHAEERYRALARSTGDAIVTVDVNRSIVAVTPAAEEAFGYWEDEVLGQPLALLLPTRLAGALENGLTPLSGRTSELAGRRRDGSEFPCELTVSTWATSEGQFFTAVFRDLTDRRQAEQERQAFEHQLAERALHDPLTALPNRVLLHDRLEQALARAARRGTRVVALTLDLDRFKAFNDTYGHPVGDELLAAVASRLQGMVRADDTIARLGGDEFALLQEDVAEPGEALEFAQRVSDAMAAPFKVSGREVTLTATIGVAVTPLDVGESDQVLRDAVVAMEHARQRGRGRVVLYDDSMRTDLTERLSVEHDLRLALEDGQLRLHYQPIVDLLSDSVVGVEALVRWEHPTRGLLPPQQFIGLAEDSGLIVPLGRWVLEQACRQGSAWRNGVSASGRQTGPESLRVSVNVSARQFQQPGWTDEVARALLTTGFDPSQLVLEITESILMEDTDATFRRLSELKELGVRIAIDDFGTGYSSLGYLRRFPVDILKVDKSFIDGVADGPHESALARAVIKLAATLNLDAVAEGVSNRKQLATLRRLRCRFAQGYYFSRPQPPDAIAALLAGPLLAVDAPSRR